MRSVLIERKKVKIIEGGKAHVALDASTASDITLLRITNLSAAHPLEVFDSEEAVAGTGYLIPAAPAEAKEGQPHFLQVPLAGDEIFFAGSGGEVEAELVAVSAANPTLSTG